MPKSPKRKAASRARILAAASRRLRRDGLAAATVAEIMADAGLTHGGFYAHFPDKAALVASALEAAMAESRAGWIEGLERLAPEEAQRQILGRYLSRAHREARGTGCPMAALGAELARADAGTRKGFEAALAATAAALEPHLAGNALDPKSRAFAVIALSVGGLTLARMVDDASLADAILLACRRLALTALSPAASAR
ncbi:MAG TPA: TetR/AcrR family transcriptional regulator [Alphaproteobacteria bacterium]|nr:TetR/AcrR family transcriptional regulator [Alphaproteobacteria bacterium]